MWLKKSKSNFIVAISFSFIMTFLVIFPLLEKKILKNNSYIQKYSKNLIMGSWPYGYGFTKTKDYYYKINFNEEMNRKYREILKKIQQAVKKNHSKHNLNIIESIDSLSILFNIDAISITEINKDNILKILKSFPEVIVTNGTTEKNKMNEYIVTIKENYKKEIKSKIKKNTIEVLKNRLINKNIIGDVKWQDDDTIKVIIYEDKFNIKDLNIEDSTIEGYVVVDGSFEIEKSKIKNIGIGENQIPVMKIPVFTRKNITKIQWIEYENFFLPVIKLDSEGEKNFLAAKNLKASSILIVSKNLSLSQEDFGNGFKVIKSGNQTYIGPLSLTQSTLNNLAIQTLFNEDSKEKITEYFNNNCLLSEIIYIKHNEYESLLSKRKAIIIFITSLILFLLMLLSLSIFSLPYGLINFFEGILILFFLIFFGRFFDLSINIFNFIGALIFFIFLFVLATWKQWKLIKIQTNDSDTTGEHLIKYKKVFKEINKKINIISISGIFLSSVLLLLFNSLNKEKILIFTALAMTAVFIVNLFFWQNIVLYVTTYYKEKQVNKMIDQK